MNKRLGKREIEALRYYGRDVIVGYHFIRENVKKGTESLERKGLVSRRTHDSGWAMITDKGQEVYRKKSACLGLVWFYND